MEIRNIANIICIDNGKKTLTASMLQNNFRG